MMDDTGKDDVPMLSGRNWQSDRHNRKVSHMNRSVTISVPMTSFESVSGETNNVGFSGPLRGTNKAQQEQAEQEQMKTFNHQWGVNDNVAKNAHLYRSGQLGMCDDPYCTTCPTSYTYKGRRITRLSPEIDDPRAQKKGWGRRAQEKLALLKQFTCGVMNPHNKAVQQWNQFIVLSCLFAIFIDPLFFYLLSTDKENKCIVINWPMTKAIVVLRSMTDFIYLMHMLVQFRLAFISPKSRVVGAGDLEDHPRKIALHYLSGCFPLDLFIVLPLPQIIVLILLPHSIGSSGANYAKNLLRTAILVQYIPRLYRFLPLIAGQSPTNFIFESAWANFVINLLTFVLAGHVVGSGWYLFGLQRVNQCLRNACRQSGLKKCKKLIDCGHGHFRSSELDLTWNAWKQNVNASACFNEDGFPYGIYVKAVNLTAESSIIKRYIYSFFWGFQMDDTGKDDVPMLSGRNWQSDRHNRKVSHMNRSVTISVPMTSFESVSGETNNVGFSGPLRGTNKAQQEQAEQEQMKTFNHQWGVNDNVAKNAHLYRSGQLGMCDDPYCTTCPTSYTYKGRRITRLSPEIDDPRAQKKGWGRRAQEKLALLKQFTCGVMNPHNKAVQQWNQFIVLSCLFAIFIDPLFFYLLSTDKENKCIVINWPMTKAIVVLRSMTDFIYLMHMLVQFRLAFISPKSRVVGAGDLEDHPRKIALHYLSGCFPLDLFIVLPLPQIIVLILLPHSIGSSGANYAKNLLRTAILVQYIPRLYRFLPLIAGQSPTNFIFESAWANFVINLLTFVLAGHVVGSGWYLFGLQRVNQCLRNACRQSGLKKCKKLIDCGHGHFRSSELDLTWNAWKQNVNASACFNEDGFPYGIYVKAVNLTAESSIIKRYIYSFFWGFQQISTLAGNLVPSYFEWEVLFTIGIIGLGLLLFALLIGNMQNFLQGLGRRRLEMSLRRRDVERWMSHRHLPDNLRRKVRESERYNWAATQGVNEANLMEHFPEDLQRDIRRHLFEFIKKVRIFAAMDEPILDAICERLRQKTYIKGGTPLYEGGILTKMVFIVRGKMESVGKDGNKVPLSEGDSCGEELLMWCLEQSSVNGDTKNQKKSGYRLLSNRTVRCLTNVEAFVLRAADLEEVTTLFAGFLRSHRVQLAIRNESPYWQGLAATTIQVAWRYRKKQLRHANTLSRGIPSKFK